MISIINEWFGITPNASEHGGMVDHMLGFVTWFMLVLFVGWSAFLVYTFWRFRASNNPKADYHGVRGHASTHIEIGVVIVEVILLFGFAFPTWLRQAEDYPETPETVKVRAMGEKFLWNFQYAGDDHMISQFNPRAISNSNTTGRVLNDANGYDDFVSSSNLKLPVGRAVIIEVRSKDVIHNLALVPMRAAQDACPGVNAHMWFKPVKEGTWDIICGQLCGPGHAQMRAVLDVIPTKEYDEWAKDQSTAAAAKNKPAAPQLAKNP
jgi:cytochrome c oxidase subunit II